MESGTRARWWIVFVLGLQGGASIDLTSSGMSGGYSIRLGSRKRGGHVDPLSS